MNKIKEILYGLGIFGVLFGGLVFGDTYQSYYTQYATVTEVTENATYFVDAIGDEWAVSDTDYEVHDTVKITFYNNHTDFKRSDDEIVKIKRVD